MRRGPDLGLSVLLFCSREIFRGEFGRSYWTLRFLHELLESLAVVLDFFLERERLDWLLSHN